MRLISRGEEAVISRSALCQLSRKWASYFGSTFGLDSLDTLDLQSLDQECYFYSYFYFVKRLVDNCECDLSTFSCRIINIEGCDRGRAVWGGTLRLRLGAVLHQLSSLVLVLGRGGHRGLRHGDPVPQRLPPPRPGPAVPRHPPRMQGGLPKVSLPNFPSLEFYYCIVLRCRLTSMIHGLRGDGLEPEVLISNLEYVQEVLGVLAQKAEYVHNLLRPHWYLHFYKQTIETILLFLLTHLQISYWGTWTKP